MKALVINKPGELQVKDLPTPTIEADEVIVRMRAVGICHSDYELYSGKYQFSQGPQESRYWRDQGLQPEWAQPKAPLA